MREGKNQKTQKCKNSRKEARQKQLEKEKKMVISRENCESNKQTQKKKFRKQNKGKKKEKKKVKNDLDSIHEENFRAAGGGEESRNSDGIKKNNENEKKSKKKKSNSKESRKGEVSAVQRLSLTTPMSLVKNGGPRPGCGERSEASVLAA